MNDELFRGQLLDQLSEKPPPPLGSLVADSEADGIRMRRNRRAAQMLAGVAGVTAVAFTASGLANSSGGTTAVSAASSTKPAVSQLATSAPSSAPAKDNSSTKGAAPSKSATQPVSNLRPNWQPTPAWMQEPAPAAVPKDAVLATGSAMAALLEQLLPDAGVAVQHATGFADDTTDPYSQHIASADLFWKNATIAIRVFEKGKGWPLGCATGMQDCADYKLPDGTHVNVWTDPGRNTPGEVKNTKTTQYVDLLRPDGTEVSLMQINGRESGNFGADRSEMPLTQQQMYAIASDPRWSTSMDAAFVHTANATVHVSEDPY
ncbi:hypothetical protein ABH935_005436 [Catenulispora sp. GAS73]|uniref:hypothetical protein n=1 Tax=Catenulispora sp. GAS73 TaxID=3156269 RepID=UPI003512B085